MELTSQQLWGTIAATAIATRCEALTRAVFVEAADVISAESLEGAKAAAAIMGMNNIYYRFHHLAGNTKYSELPARLRMSALRGHGVDFLDFELWCLAVSAVNACGKCVDSHERVLREKGATEELINAAIRVTSVVHALGVVLDAEAATRSM